MIFKNGFDKTEIYPQETAPAKVSVVYKQTLNSGNFAVCAESLDEFFKGASLKTLMAAQLNIINIIKERLDNEPK